MKLPIIGQDQHEEHAIVESPYNGRIQREGWRNSIAMKVIKGPLIDPHFYKTLPKTVRGMVGGGKKLRTDGSGKVEPMAISVDTTKFCNLDCVGCYDHSGPEDFDWRARPQLTLQEWRNRLDEVTSQYDIVHATWVGGEPMFEMKHTVKPGVILPEGGRYSKDGRIFTEERWRVVEEGANRIPYNMVVTNAAYAWDLPKWSKKNVSFVVSIDGTRPYHDAVRGRGNYDKSKARILSRPDLKFNITTVLNRSNWDCVEDLTEEWIDVPNVYGIAFSIGTKIANQREFDGDKRGGEVGANEGYHLPWDLRDQAIERVIKIQERYPRFVFPSRGALELMTSSRFREAVGYNGDKCPLKAGTVMSLDSMGVEKQPCILGPGADCNTCGCIIPYTAASTRNGVGPLQHLTDFMGQYTHYR